MSPVPNHRPRLIGDILQKAATDPAFRARLLVEPAEAIRDAFGVVVPPGYRMRFVERDPDVDALIVLPEAQGVELSDEELDDVAGGSGSNETWLI